MAEILSLPDHVLEMIAAKTATSLSEYETSWGAAAMTCKRLHNVQLPAEYVAVHDYQSTHPSLTALPVIPGIVSVSLMRGLSPARSRLASPEVVPEHSSTLQALYGSCQG